MAEAGPSTVSQPSVAKIEAEEFLRSLLNKNLRVTTTDGRMFWGPFKCTDPESNVILAHAYEYRAPSLQKQAEEAQRKAAGGGGGGTVAVDMTSRYLGLVVVPGKHIVKIEVEEFASQMPSQLRLPNSTSLTGGLNQTTAAHQTSNEGLQWPSEAPSTLRPSSA